MLRADDDLAYLGLFMSKRTSARTRLACVISGESTVLSLHNRWAMDDGWLAFESDEEPGFDIAVAALLSELTPHLGHTWKSPF